MTLVVKVAVPNPSPAVRATAECPLSRAVKPRFFDISEGERSRVQIDAQDIYGHGVSEAAPPIGHASGRTTFKGSGPLGERGRRRMAAAEDLHSFTPSLTDDVIPTGIRA